MPENEKDPTAQKILRRLRADARRLCWLFDLEPKVIAEESSRVKWRLGSCTSDGIIRLRLHTLDGRYWLQYPSLLGTLCHELAHLKYMSHGREHTELYRRIVHVARLHQKVENGRP